MKGKKDISKIITQGSLKQRLNLLMNYVTEKSVIEFLGNIDRPEPALTSEDFWALVSSFKTEKEIKAYNKFNKVHDGITSILPYISQLRLAWRESIASINGFALYIMTVEDILEDINFTLYQTKQRKRFVEALIENGKLLYGKYRVDKEGFLYYNPAEDHQEPEGRKSLLSLINIHKDTAKHYLVLLKASIQAVRDIMDEMSMHIELVHKALDVIEEELINYKPTYQQFDRRTWDEKDLELMGKWRDFYPHYDEIELDKEVYQKIRRDLQW